MAIGAVAMVDFGSADGDSDDMGVDPAELPDAPDLTDFPTDEVEDEADGPPEGPETRTASSEEDDDGPDLPSAAILSAQADREGDPFMQDSDPLGVESLVDEMLGEVHFSESLSPASPIGEDADEGDLDLAGLDDVEDDQMDDETETDPWEAWFGEDPELARFDPDTEELLVIWDDSHGDEPEVSFATGEDGSGTTDIMVDGMSLGQISADSGLAAEHIALVPLSTAQGLGWAPV